MACCLFQRGQSSIQARTDIFQNNLARRWLQLRGLQIKEIDRGAFQHLNREARMTLGMESCSPLAANFSKA